MNILSRQAIKTAAAVHPGGAFSSPAPQKFGFIKPHWIEASVILADLFILVIASYVCLTAYSIFAGVNQNSTTVSLSLLVALNFTAIMAARKNYRLRRLVQISVQFRETISVWAVVFGALALAGFTMKVSADFSRGAVITFLTGGAASILLFRILIAGIVSRAVANSWFVRREIIIIAEQGYSSSSAPLKEMRQFGYRPIKTFEITKHELSTPGINWTLREKLTDVICTVRDRQISEVYLLFNWANRRAIDLVLDVLTVLPISVHLVPDESTARYLRNPVVAIGSHWTAELRRPPLSRMEQWVKRAFDILVALLALVLLLPLMLLTALLIKLDSPGPIFFRQTRNGFNGRRFGIFKFRTMRVLENGASIKQATRNDLRTTAIGRLLRKSSIDELPQLFNVIIGEMSIVGPRPHASAHNSEYEKLIATYALRHHVKPGITGWAQVNGLRGETSTIDLMQRRVEHDLWYINNWSLVLDAKIAMRTVTVSLIQTDAY
jgi:Undecaprenyl-phosphate glucose phosphotransferase